MELFKTLSTLLDLTGFYIRDNCLVPRLPAKRSVRPPNYEVKNLKLADVLVARWSKYHQVFTSETSRKAFFILLKKVLNNKNENKVQL